MKTRVTDAQRQDTLFIQYPLNHIGTGAQSEKVRPKLFLELQDKIAQNVFKGSRWILLKNPEHLNPQRGVLVRT